MVSNIKLPTPPCCSFIRQKLHNMTLLLYSVRQTTRSPTPQSSRAVCHLWFLVIFFPAHSDQYDKKELLTAMLQAATRRCVAIRAYHALALFGALTGVYWSGVSESRPQVLEKSLDGI